MRHSEQHIETTLAASGIVPGASVSWNGIGQRRYGCVLAILPKARVRAVACNGEHDLPAAALQWEPDISDPVMADYDATYPVNRGVCVACGDRTEPGEPVCDDCDYADRMARQQISPFCGT